MAFFISHAIYIDDETERMQKKIFSYFGPKPGQYETCEPQEDVTSNSKSSEQGPSPKVSSSNVNDTLIQQAVVPNSAIHI
jgi:hypothetical protein